MKHLKHLKRVDALADDEAPIHKINLDGKTKYQSELGGFFTLTLVVAFSLVLIKEGGEVLSMSYPFT